ncbi:MAG: glycosyltransferase family 2 protein [Candidatus Magasanikbacteria bacterium]
MRKLSVQLVTWNGEDYIPYLFDSLRDQTFDDWKLNILDNNSDDNTLEALEKELEDFEVNYHFQQNDTNVGFAPGHNKLFRETNSEYFLMLNQDMYLQPDCLEKLVDFLDKNQEAAGVTPRLMRWKFDLLKDKNVEENDLLKQSFTDQVDSLGMKIFKNRRVIEQYTQKKWSKIKDKFDSDTREVFGVSGAFPMFRRSSIEEITFDNGNYLDEDYHSYKEDVDLAYRLQSSGNKAYVILDTVAYHDRSAAGPENPGIIATIKNKLDQSEWVKKHSYKNHLMTLYKNEYWQNFLLDFPFIFWYELKKFIWYLLFDPKVLKSLATAWSLRDRMKEKREQIKKGRVKNYKEMRENWL